MLNSKLGKSGTKEMQVICSKCFEHCDPSFETENEPSNNLFESFPESLMKLFYLPATREDALCKFICSYIFSIQALGDICGEVTEI
jgi:hypothetical protein